MTDYAAMGLEQSVWDTRRPTTKKPLTSEEKNRIASRERYRKKVALRVNPNTYNPTTQADADKRARLMGNSFNGATL